MAKRVYRTPEHLGKTGRALWKGATDGAVHIDTHELEMIGQWASIADTIDALNAQLAVDPCDRWALRERRQQQLTMARLAVVLGFEFGDSDDAAPPQKRSVRGVYAIRGGSA